MGGVQEQNRRRLALALCLAGVCLILIGVSLAIQERSQIEAARHASADVSGNEKVQLAHAIRGVLFWLLVLVGVFAVSSFAFLRWSRHFRAQLFRKPRPPTPDEDVWAMHRLPDVPGPDRIDGDDPGYEPGQ